MGIAKGLGKPIRVDQTTLKFERARYARICVEVNLAKPLKGTVLINGERYFVAYEGLSEICSKCGIYGHLVHGCPKAIAERMATVALQKEDPPHVVTESPREVLEHTEDGFTPVRGPRRGVTQAPRPVITMSRKSNEEVDRSGRRIQSDKGAEKMVLSNKYGSLDLDKNTEESMDEVISGQENKENQEVNIQSPKDAEALTEKEPLVFGASGGSNLNGVNKERGNGNKKTMEGVKGKPKKLNNRPVRGLVLGPTKGEMALSESGKRLRVENSDAGRPGGVFRDCVGIGDPPQSLQLRDEVVENPMEITRSETGKQMVVEPQTKSQEEEVVVSLA